MKEINSSDLLSGVESDTNYPRTFMMSDVISIKTGNIPVGSMGDRDIWPALNMNKTKIKGVNKK